MEDLTLRPLLRAGWDCRVLCPCCENTYVHLANVVVNQGGDITTINKDGTAFQEGLASGRGTNIKIGMWCESGHGFALGFQFHKGQTFVSCGEADAEETAELWRD